MVDRTQKLLEQALQLPVNERAKLADELLASIDEGSDPDAEAAWAKEIERRAEEAEKPDWKGEPWDVVRARIERQLRGG